MIFFPWSRRTPCRVALLLLSVLLGPVAAPSSLPAAAPSPAVPLAPARPHQATLARTESHLYRVPLHGDKRWYVQVEQTGVDIELLANWSGGEAWRIDSPLDRDGVELLLLPPDAVGEVDLTVTALAVAGAAGSYRITVQGLDQEAPQLVALEAVSRAGRAYAAGDGVARQTARQQFLLAAELWRTLDEPRFAAQGTYAVAVLHRLLGDEPSALDLARQVLPEWRTLGDAGREADTLNEIGLLESSADRLAEARQAFLEALAVQERIGDPFRQAATANNLCLLHLFAKEHRRALDCYASALELIRAAGDEEHEAVALTNQGWAHRSLGEAEEALGHFRRAASLHRTAGRQRREAETLNNLAMLYRQMGEPQEAVGLYLRALEIFRRQGDERWQGTVLHNLGTVYHMLGDPERARVLYLQALSLRRQLGNLPGEANTLRLLGRLELDDGQPQEAAERFRRALELERQTQDSRGEAIVRRLIGQSRAAVGDHRTALTDYNQALAVLRAEGDRLQEAQTLFHAARSRFQLGHLQAAKGDLASAAETFRWLGMELSVGETLYELAVIEHAAGRGSVALELVDQAIGRVEALRAEVGDPDLRASFSGARWGTYELRIELLMSLHEQSGENRYLAAALETSERARATGLVELLRQAGAAIFDGIDVELERRLRSARRKLHVEAGNRRRLLTRSPSAARTSAEGQGPTAEAELVRALTELEGLEAQVRRQSPQYAALSRPEPLTAAQIQGVLDPDTALIEIALGDRRSFLFVVTPQSLGSFELPPRGVVEAAARRAHDELSSLRSGGSPNGDGRGVDELAQMLRLSSLAGLAAERLVVVADGALHYVPFAALPLSGHSEPGPGRRPASLLSRFEVIHLPSASVLAEVRRQSAGRPLAPRWAAILADPVFDAQDSRLAAAPLVEDMAKNPERGADGGRQAQGLDLPRLRSSRREAEILAALAPSDEVLVALDFEADRPLAMGGELARYRIVHFATHSVIDARYPALSGLALSLFDRQGQPRDGFLRLHDIYGLRLQADLVVLSACRTALGKEVRGEGLLGLTRGFLHAGAQRVVASLWSVPDRATSELMGRFYAAMVEDGLSPAAALRRAQLSMQAERRWREPYNWAGFVLLGEWRDALCVGCSAVGEIDGSVASAIGQQP